MLVWACTENGRKQNYQKVLYMNLETRSLRGRPQNRWQDEMREDGRIVGGKGWKERVYNREEWKMLLRTTRNRRLLHMQMEWIVKSVLAHSNSHTSITRDRRGHTRNARTQCWHCTCDMVHYGQQWCGICGIPTLLFACLKNTSSPTKYWQYQVTQTILLQVITRITAKYDKSDLLSLATPLLQWLIVFHPPCSVIYISPSTGSRHSCRNMRPHLFPINLCLGMILPYLPGQRDPDTSRSVPCGPLLSSLSPLTPSRKSFSSSPRHCCRSC